MKSRCRPHQFPALAFPVHDALRSLLVLIGVATALLPTTGWAESAPHGSLRQAFATLRAGEAARAAELFRSAGQNSDLAAWALIGQALALEQLGKTNEALETSEKIPAGSAASLDAMVLRLSVKPETLKLEEISKEQSKLERAERDDLVAKLLSIAFAESIRRKESARAMAFYRELRPRLFRHFSLPLGLQSRRPNELFDSLLPLLNSAERDSLLLFEAQQSLASKDAPRALELLAKRRVHDAPAEIVRAKALRATGKAAEALAGLIRAAKEIPLGQDTLLLELVRIAWNENKLAETRKYAAELMRLSPKSSAAAEAEHSAALSWIIGGDWSRGAKALEQLARRRPTSDFQTLAIRDLAWLAMRRRDAASAVRWFDEYRAASDARLKAAPSETNPAERAKRLRDAKFEEEHARFWLAELCKKSEGHKQAGPCTKSPAAALYESLLVESPVSYYRMLAAERLGRAFPPPEFLVEAKASDEESECSVPADVDKTLKAIHLEDLPWLLHVELATFLSTSSSATHRSEKCRIALAMRFGDVPAGIKATELALRTGTIGRELTPPQIAGAAFPRPYLESYRAARQEKGVPVPFALAITRTESHFDHDARSTSDARGLMQLLPSTAALEGLGDPEQLFDAETNIKTGTQHLSRLFRSFNGNEDFVAGAYNGGREAVLRWKNRTTPGQPKPTNDFETLGMDAWIETIPYGETRNYIKKVRLARRWYAALIKTD